MSSFAVQTNPDSVVGIVVKICIFPGAHRGFGTLPDRSVFCLLPWVQHMANLRLLQEQKSYTFRSYLEFNAEPEEILAELGYQLLTQRLTLPTLPEPLAWADELQERLERSLKLVSLTSEAARREVLVAPILLGIAHHCCAQIRIEYPLTVSDWLKGTLDYLIRMPEDPHNLVVVEAKREDLTRGFTQLATELIALATAQETEVVYGAVTLGDVWRFGRLDARSHVIVQDIALFRVPDDLGALLRVLSGILQGAVV
ncbi:MAG: hypothetical protein ACO4AI_04800 [Prochlorothrix sp.]